MVRPKGTGGQAKELSRDEIQRIDKCLTGTRHEHRNRALLYLGLGSGMRISELVSLKLKDIKAHDQVLPQIILEKHSTKSRRSRTVYLSKQAITAVRDYLSKELKDQPAENALFPSQKKQGQALSPNAAVTILKKMFQRAAVTHASSHSLRRTHANALRRRGVDLKIIQEQLGHSSLAVTEKYFQVDPLEAHLAVSQLRF